MNERETWKGFERLGSARTYYFMEIRRGSLQFEAWKIL